MLIALLVGLFMFCLLATACNIFTNASARLLFAVATAVLAGCIYHMTH